MTISVEIAADSIHPKTDSPRLTTMLLRYPRFIHSELMSHRVFSRNASSSRAIPIRKMIDAVVEDPAYPVEWGLNEPGMQARKVANKETAEQAKEIWDTALYHAVRQARRLMDLGMHKQIVNRVLEPFSHISVIVTSTEWDNFFSLRCHPDADPTIRALAVEMRDAYQASEPTETMFHLPLVPEFNSEKPLRHYMNLSVARCARVSYLTHSGRVPNEEEDINLANRLLGSRHFSPFEHQAMAAKTTDTRLTRNLTGWIQHRAMIDR